MDCWCCFSVSLCVSVFSRERRNVQMLRASLSETDGIADTLVKRVILRLTCLAHTDTGLDRHSDRSSVFVILFSIIDPDRVAAVFNC